MSAEADGFRVRAARPEDAAAIGEIHVETWRSTYAGILPDTVLLRMSRSNHTASWARGLAQRGRAEFVLVAEAPGGAVVGFGSAGPLRRGEQREGEVYTLYVLPDYHGLGLGRRLICGLFRELHGRGFGSALIWVLAENPTRFFYEAMGGARSVERVERLWGADLPEIGYVWPDLSAALGPGGPCGEAEE